MPAEIRLLIVDDNLKYKQSLTRIVQSKPGYLLTGEASDGLEAVEKALTLKPDVILMDINMPQCSGLEAVLRIRSSMPQIEFLMLTASDTEADLFLAIKYGAKGYLLKDSAPQTILDAIKTVAEGQSVVSPSMAMLLIREFRRLAPITQPSDPTANSNLTDRENEILGLLARGLQNREIANKLVVSENTVKTHLKNIMRKLHINNRSQATAYAVTKGITL